MSQYTPNDAYITIQLTKGAVSIVDAVDSDLASLKWRLHSGGYAHGNSSRRTGSGKGMFLHRQVLERKIGRSLVKGEECDHINGDKLDNRRGNLRLSSHRNNMRNQPGRANHLKGAYKHRRKWAARITVDYRVIELGNYDTPEEAHQAYCDAAVKYFGEFARFK